MPDSLCTRGYQARAGRHSTLIGPLLRSSGRQACDTFITFWQNHRTQRSLYWRVLLPLKHRRLRPYNHLDTTNLSFAAEVHNSMGYSKVLPFNAQALIDAAKPIIDKAQPYINTVWTHLEPHAATSRTHINTFFHGYEPWQILALASAATLVLMKVVSRLLT